MKDKLVKTDIYDNASSKKFKPLKAVRCDVFIFITSQKDEHH